MIVGLFVWQTHDLFYSIMNLQHLIEVLFI